MADTFPSLVYPLEMRPEGFYPEAMCFTIKKRFGVSLEDVGKMINKNAQKPIDKFNKQQELTKQHMAKLEYASTRDKEAHQALKELADAEFARASKELGLSNVLVEGWDFAKGTVGDISDKVAEQKKLQKKNTTVNNIGHIYLNMPQAITYDDSISWDAKPLGTVGAIMDSGFSTAAAGDVIGNAGNIAGAGVGAMLSGLVGKMGIGSIGIGALLGGMAGGEIQSGLSASLGMTSNPYEEMMFSGITFRSFSFDFIFRPDSSDEIEAVHDIINRFRRHSRPTFSEGAFGKSVMDYPMEFDIQFLTAEKGEPKLKGNHAMEDATGGDIVYVENTHLPKIKTCVCDKVSTNYTPNGVWSAYAAGAPIAITMGLGFKEKTLVMEQDISQGY